MRFPIIYLLAATLLGAALPQKPAPPIPYYDVVSIKPHKADDTSTYWRSNDDSFSATNIDIAMLVVSAYDTRHDLISGLPAWAQDVHFDINAKIVDPNPEAPKGLTPRQSRAMLAEVLADRFHLKIHTEVKELPVYELVPAKGGSRLKPNAALPDKGDPVKSGSGMGAGMAVFNPGDFTGVGVPVSYLVSSLASQLQRNIVDRTGLTGNYDIYLKWTPDGATPAGPDSAQTDGAPPLFTALQEQLGLRLVPGKGPVQTYVIDHVEQPTGN